VPVRLTPEDFEVVETEALSRSATVLLVDLSMSMPMRDNFVPAEEDGHGPCRPSSAASSPGLLGIVGFSRGGPRDPSRRAAHRHVDYVTGPTSSTPWPSGGACWRTSTGTKQIIVVTDGEPTAHIDDAGEVWFNYPPIPETLQRTMGRGHPLHPGQHRDQLLRPRSAAHALPFVEQIARVNGGRTFYTTPDNLGGYVLVDFLQHRRILRPAG